MLYYTTYIIKDVIKDVLGRIPWNFRRKPTVLLIFFKTDFKCSSKLNFESNIIPKCL